MLNDNDNVKKILPKLFISNAKDNTNINNIINVNGFWNKADKLAKVINVNVGYNEEFIVSDKKIDINWDEINNFIIECITKNEPVVILDGNYNISLLIVGVFLMNHVELTLTETVNYLCNVLNIHKYVFPKNIIKQLYLLNIVKN